MSGEWRLITRTFYGADVWWRNNGDGTFTVRETQDVESILDNNRAMSLHNDGYSKDRTLRRAASIPMTIIADYRSNGVNLLHPDNSEDLKKIMNDGDYSKIRTAPGRI